MLNDNYVKLTRNLTMKLIGKVKEYDDSIKQFYYNHVRKMRVTYCRVAVDVIVLQNKSKRI